MGRCCREQADRSSGRSHDAASSTFSPTSPVTRSTKSGAWSDPATWVGNGVPGVSARVHILEGHRVEYDVQADAVIRGINIAGTLAFATDKDTLLNVGLIKIQAGDVYSEEGFDCEEHGAAADPSKPRPALIVGTADRPIAPGKKAHIRLHYVEGMNQLAQSWGQRLRAIRAAIGAKR